jgi:hypothetical protein
MRWRMTASLRASATRAFLPPTLFTSRAAHAFGADYRRTRLSSEWAAS